MAAKIRLARVGSKKNPIYRVVVADSRSPRDGRFIEIVGRYNPQTEPSTIELDEAKVKDWIAKGAQPTEPVSRLIRAAGISLAHVAELLEWLARRLVDEPDAVRVETEEREDAIVFHLHVAPDDVGKVIGKQGRIARALRSIVRAGGARADERYVLEIAD
jgi:small subunit ribosomal protein S16